MAKVLHIVYNLIRGGSEGQCARIAMAFAGQGHRVAAFRREGLFLDPVEKACGPVHEIGIEHMVSFGTFRRLQRLQRFIRLERFDLVHCWDADSVIFGSAAAQWAGIPYITSQRDMGQIYPPYKLALMRRAHRHARAVVANADAIVQTLERAGLDSSKVWKIPNLLDIDEFNRLAAQPLEPPGDLSGRRWIVMVARLDPEKDTASLVRGFGLIAPRFADVDLAVVGDGREMESLRQLAAQLRLAQRVRFLGDVPNVPALLKQAEVGALVPKSNEGLSNTILEYMAASLPVVASRCGGNAELVEDGRNGRLVPAEDPPAIAEALGALLSRPQEAEEMGREGRRRVEEKHAPEKVIPQFEKLYTVP